MQAQGFSEELGLEDTAELDDTAYDQAGASPSMPKYLIPVFTLQESICCVCVSSICLCMAK